MVWPRAGACAISSCETRTTTAGAKEAVVADHALHVLDCGTLTFPRHGIYFNGGEEIIVAPIPAHIITHPEGNVLYDTGFPIGAFSDPSYFGEGLAGYKPGNT